MAHPALSHARRTTDYVRLLVRDLRRSEREREALKRENAELKRIVSLSQSAERQP